jgi:hypothetical protein
MESCARWGAGSFSFGPPCTAAWAAQGGPASPHLRDTAPSTCSGVDCHRSRLTKRRQERSCGVVPWTAGPNPHSRRVTSVRAALARTTRLINQRSAPPGGARIGSRGRAFHLFWRKCVTGLTQARATDAYPGARAPETVLVRRSGTPPVAASFLALGRESCPLHSDPAGRPSTAVSLGRVR